MAIFLLGAAAAARARTPAPALAVAPYRYCTLVVADRYFESPGRVQLDYGQGAPGAVADPEMAEMAQNVSGSWHIIDGLNYLSRHGWELVTVTTVPSASTTSGTNFNHVLDSETRYLRRRRS